MKYQIEWLENKSPEWKIATLSENGHQVMGVSINKNDKKTGQVAFANFDTLMPGNDIEGELWTSPKGGMYLFPPRPQSAPKTTGNAGIKVAMAEKAKNIEHNIDRKDNSILLSATFRDATLLTVAHLGQKGTDFSSQDIQDEWKIWRTWLMEQFGDAGDITETKKPL